MALEAIYQKHCALLQPEESASIARNDLSYRFRNVRFSRALVLEAGKDAVITLTLTAVPGSKDWHEFRISTVENDISSENCSGLVRIQDPIDEPVQGEDALPLRSPQAPRLWYKRQREIGMDFGPTFQKLIEIEAVTGQRECRTLVSLEPPAGKYDPQSYYPIHPAALDGCLQTPVPSNASCDRTNVKHVMIPALIDDFVINKVPSRLSRGLSKATSVYSGRGRLEQEKSWIANTTVYDFETGQLAMRIRGLNYAKLDVAPKPDPHTFHSVVWRPDVTALNQDQIIYLDTTQASSKLDTVIDLIAHKKPALRILEINLEDTDTSCIWFEAGDSSARAAYGQYTFGSPDAKILVNIETQFKEKGNVSFHLIDANSVTLNLSAETGYDLAIIKASGRMSDAYIEKSVMDLRSLLPVDAFTLVVHLKDDGGIASSHSQASENFEDVNIHLPVLDTPPTSSPSASSPVRRPDNPNNCASPVSELAKGSTYSADLDGGSSVLEIPATTDSPQAYLTRSIVTAGEVLSPSPQRHLIVVRLSETTPEALPPSLQAALEGSGWSIQQQVLLHHHKLVPGSVTLVLDELSGPVLSRASGEQWEAMKRLVSSGNPLLWVTNGAQSRVTDPNNALVHGLFRVIRQEDPTARLTTLDVQSSTSPATICAVDEVLRQISRANADPAGAGAAAETEYMERDGILHVPRIMPDSAVNDFRRAEVEGLEPVVRPFHGTDVQVQLRAERLGTLQGLMWCETEVNGDPALAAGYVEVEVMAVGVNFKDVAITMGIVPDNEYNIGFECAGVVKRLGPGVTQFQVGDRVCILKAGSYANRIRVSVQRCHLIPASMTFEEAATIPSVYLCSLYAMYHLGGLKEGQVRFVFCCFPISRPSLRICTE